MGELVSAANSIPLWDEETCNFVLEFSDDLPLSMAKREFDMMRGLITTKNVHTTRCRVKHRVS
jgi:hypothetical protein